MHILHLEDDGPLREVLKAVLMTADPTVNVHQFIASDDAVQYIQEHAQEIDLFILDVRVPGTMDGMGVAQKIRELGCRGAIVITSAYRRPNPALLSSLECKWMPKPWHILDATKTLLPLARERSQQKQGSEAAAEAEKTPASPPTDSGAHPGKANGTAGLTANQQHSDDEASGNGLEDGLETGGEAQP